MRSFSSVPLGSVPVPSGHGGGKQQTPDRRPGAAGGSRCERWTYERVDTRLREPPRHVQVIPCVRIRRRLCLLGSHIVNGVDAGAAILWNPCA